MTRSALKGQVVLKMGDFCSALNFTANRQDFTCFPVRLDSKCIFILETLNLVLNLKTIKDQERKPPFHHMSFFYQAFLRNLCMFPWLTVIYQQLPCLSPLRCFRMLRTTLLPDSAVGHRLPSFSLGKAAWQHAVQLNGAGPRHFELNSCWDAEAQPFHWCLSFGSPTPTHPRFPTYHFVWCHRCKLKERPDSEWPSR